MLKLRPWPGFRKRRGADDPAFESIRAELFSVERLEQQAETLAASQGKIAPRKTRGRNLLPRIRSNHRVLIKAYQQTSREIVEERAITPAAEWLIDNFHIVEDQLREIRDDLPPSFYRTLPKLTTEPFAGYPRVYGLAWTFVAHTDSRLDREWMRRFITAYQKLEPLQIGEVWAFAISLRIVLVDNLRRSAERIMRSRAERHQADTLADAILGLRGKSPEDPASLLDPFEGSPLRQAFAVQLLHRLREQDARATPVLQWLEKRLAAQGTTSENIIRAEHQAQTAMNSTVRNVITSMRLLSAMDWTQFFEDVSVVDEILRASAGFASMDFATRDHYRHAIEELSRGSGMSETDIARRAVEVSRVAAQAPVGTAAPWDAGRRFDPGYFLISEGRREFEKDIGFRPTLQDRFVRLFRAAATPGYLGTVGFATALALSVPIYISRHSAETPLLEIGLALLALIPASDFGVSLVNRLVADLIGPKLIPKLDFSTGIPESATTLVVMPTLLSNLAAVENQITNLETHFLSNPDGHTQFALLSDWADAAEESAAGDEILTRAAEEGIRQLNERYGSGPNGSVRFLLLHRRRLWNPTENVWMGWERKRGKIHELNRLIRGDVSTTFLMSVGNPHRLRPDIRLVVTLDADTRMSRGAVYRLSGAMAHPLNRPYVDPQKQKVMSGYGLMQPRITPVLAALEPSSIYQRIFSGPAGIDPYAFAVSDVYQDLFGEGSYVGKGIYDVDAFESALRDRIPENTVLSHDLFEGLYARTALVSDVEFFDEFPSEYEAAAARLHRWMRGDWQLLPLLLRRNNLSWIGRWKIFDNLRRSLSAPASLALFMMSIFSRTPLLWMGFLAVTFLIPAFLPNLLTFLPRTRRFSVRHHFRGARSDAALAGAQVLAHFIFLAHEAWLSIDAVLRTLYRLLVSHRHLLQWVSSSEMKDIFDTHVSVIYRRMYTAPVLGVAATALAVHQGGAAGVALGVLGLTWMFSPAVAKAVSAPVIAPADRPLTDEDRQLFRLIARRTWSFFETFVDPLNNDLPPDNFQEVPKPVVARRTSPTNIGLYLLSAAAAHDFGWLGLLDTLERLQRTVSTIEKLRRHEGHLFNWYDTQDLRPLEPLYVSTVDSGNLAGHLLALSNACREFKERALRRPEIFEGARDTLQLIALASHDISDVLRTGTVTLAHWNAALETLRRTLTPVHLTENDWRPRLADAAAQAETLTDMALTLSGPADSETLRWCRLLSRQLQSHLRDFDHLQSAEGKADIDRRCDQLVEFCTRTVDEMNFTFLFDPIKKIFSIGYAVGSNTLDPSYYDLLASEARLASFIAIAKGDVPSIHWFRLTRSFVSVEGGLALLSWSGSMFEYLMPALVMREPPGSLLYITERRVVRRQIHYGAQKKVPWGISEAGYNARDLELTYQYSNFGVPGLGLKRGLSKDLLIAPYATALAAMVMPGEAAENFRRLKETGAEGPFGYYEALDYTPVRLPEGEKVAVVRSYMAHHQGMSLVSFTNLLQNGNMRRRFHAESLVKAAELLLQERMPRNAAVAHMRSDESLSQIKIHDTSPALSRRYSSPHDSPPRTHLLSNGRYSVMLTSAGSGYSGWRHLAVTRWRQDPTRDARGTFIYLRDVETGEVWSAAYQPRGVEPDEYLVDFSDDRAQFIRRDSGIVTTMEVVVSPEDDAEIRRVTLKNESGRERVIEITSYAEIVLAPPAADLAHSAFSNLFVETEFVPAVNGIVCTRRPRSSEELQVWAAHVIAVQEPADTAVEFESDRERFLGRGREVRTPMSVLDGNSLSNTVGAVLDPVVSLRQRVRIAPGEFAKVSFSTLISGNKEETLALADKYHDSAIFERTLTLAWTQAQVQRHYLGADVKDLHLYQELARRLLYPHADMRSAQETLKRNSRGASGLWAHGISGDLPIVLVRIDEPEDREIVHQLLRAHEYWRMKQLDVDVIILNEKAGSYQQELQETLEALVRASQASHRHQAHEPHGGIFILQADRLSFEDRILILSAARLVLLSHHGTLADQLERHERPISGALPVPTRAAPVSAPEDPKIPSIEALEFFNGLGGFDQDGREYRIVMSAGQRTPAPWTNVISNPRFGFLSSESGAGYTWAENSRENKLTPWSNDPVSDSPGEVFYVRDEHSGDVWTPTALPIREEAWPYIATHGQGFSRFEHESHDIKLDLLQFVPPEDPVKISRLKITNQSNRTRVLSITAYVEWVLGVSREATSPFIVTERDEKTGAILARNVWNTEFAERVAFADMAGRQTEWTTDRTEFLGRNGSPTHPASLDRGMNLMGRSGAGLDPCAALKRTIQLAPGASQEVVLFLGQAENREQSLAVLNRVRSADLNKLFADVRRRWEDLLGAVQVRTPDRAMDILLNRWLQYQTISCRIWARAGFYQAGGAYGFRDQLQDVLSTIATKRDIAREQILRAAARQFPEGDVQHWWHPPSGRGVRTKISDDLLWLAFAVVQYIEVTGEFEILDEEIPFVQGPAVPQGKEDAYFQPSTTTEKATLFEHCARALDRSLKTGAHGLPLMGSGDWNDGMNRVGLEGQGESIWLAWFLHSVLWEFSKIADRRNESARAQTWRLHVSELKTAVERTGWDGEWYKRAFFDDGTPLGSKEGAECRIDSIAQSWAVLSGAADPARAAQAMASLEKNLIKWRDGIILLFTPPFEHSQPSPGYIQGYLKGVRENGGQYTHAGVWALMAFAALGDGDKAGELFGLMNPIRHSSARANIHRYKVEPYVMAGDVYSEAPHTGRGGWTWYTGSAGWMYRAGVESILGVRLRGNLLFMDPCIPRAWPKFSVTFRYHASRYEVTVENPHHISHGAKTATLDGQPVRGDGGIRLLDDGRVHHIKIVLQTPGSSN